MLIAHLPVGYLLTRTISKQPFRWSVYWLGLLGAIFPDFDLIYFYTLGGRQHVHHSYWTHLPIFWLGVGVIIYTLYKLWPKVTAYKNLLIYFMPNILLHLLMDSVSAAPNTSHRLRLAAGKPLPDLSLLDLVPFRPA